MQGLNSTFTQKPQVYPNAQTAESCGVVTSETKGQLLVDREKDKEPWQTVTLDRKQSWAANPY